MAQRLLEGTLRLALDHLFRIGYEAPNDLATCVLSSQNRLLDYGPAAVHNGFFTVDMGAVSVLI